MIVCPKCGRKNPEDAEFCNKCGFNLKKVDNESGFEKNIEHFGEEIDKIGKRLEEKGKKVESWYHKKFGFFGPILSSLIAFVILLIVIRLLFYFGKNRTWMASIAEFLEPFLILFLVIFLLSSFSSYFSKKYKGFRFFSPIIGVVVFLVWFWVAINILYILSDGLEIAFLETFAEIFELLIIPIAILVLLVGYLSIFMSTKSHIEDKSSNKPKKETIGSQEDFRFKRLYRSGRDRILGGVCGGIAEYLKIDPVIIRLIFVIALFASVGFIVVAYFIFWIIVPRNPKHEW